MSEVVNFIEVIKACEAASGAGSKEVIQNVLRTLNFEGRRLVKLAQNPYIIFGVKKIIRPDNYAEIDNYIQPFFTLLGNLTSRELTGNAAKNAVTEILRTYTAETALYLERVIEKNLRAGFSADTYNKVWPTDTIPTFEVMKAQKFPEEFEKEITYPCLAEHKLDGIRTIAIVYTDSINYFNRSGKEEETINGLFDKELFELRKLVGYDFVIDGERYGENFKRTVNAKREGDDDAKSDLKYYAFFMMPIQDWIAKKTKITMQENRTNLEKLITEINSDKLTTPFACIVYSYSDVLKCCNYAIDTEKVEGLILKKLSSPYIWDRDMAWCKVKRFHDVNAKIINFYYGKKKTRLEHTIAGVECSAELEDGTPVQFKVGSGFSDNDRADMLANQEEWLKKTLLIKYQEVSIAANKKIASLRFTTFERTI